MPPTAADAAAPPEGGGDDASPARGGEAASVSPEERARRIGHRGAVVWLTGYSGAGKTTIGLALERRLTDAGHLAFVLDGDVMRRGLCADLGFSPADRTENVRRVGEVAALMADAGLIVIACFISPFRAARDRARQAARPERFFEIFVDAPLDVCERRDPKGLYRRARAGELREFTGISSPYEPPVAPALVLETHRLGVDACVERILALLRAAGILSGD